jgi:hypothetical protein
MYTKILIYNRYNRKNKSDKKNKTSCYIYTTQIIEYYYLILNIQ